jgi:hypothetical protein
LNCNNLFEIPLNFKYFVEIPLPGGGGGAAAASVASWVERVDALRQLHRRLEAEVGAAHPLLDFKEPVETPY